MEAARHNKPHVVWFHLWILFIYDSRVGKSVETDLEVRLLLGHGVRRKWGMDFFLGNGFKTLWIYGEVNFMRGEKQRRKGKI